MVEHLAPGKHRIELRRLRTGSHEEHVLASREVEIAGRTVLAPWVVD